MKPDYTPQEGKILKLFIKYADAARPKIEKFLGINFDYYITLRGIKIGAGADKEEKIIYFGKDGIIGAYENCVGKIGLTPAGRRCFKFVARFLMLHEALHILGMIHNKEGRKLGYRSDLTKDKYTRKLIRQVFKYTKDEVSD